MNLIDRAVAFFAPESGLKRARARLALDVMAGYNGARRDRRQKNWTAPSTGPNEDLKWDLLTLRDRAREQVRNNPYASKAVTALTAHFIGTGIQARISGMPGDEMQDMKDAWKYFVDECDFTGDTDLYGLQALAARCTIESGEALALPKPAKYYQNLKVPMQIQLLEPDHLDARKEVKDTGRGGFISQGIEFDNTGRKIAYWLFPRHPGDALRKQESKRVPAEEVIHLYEKTRIGAIHAAPWLAPVLITMKDLDDYNEAELFAKKIQACYAIIVTSDAPDKTVGVTTTDSQTGVKTEKIKPGMQMYNTIGDDVKFAAPSITPGYGDYNNYILHKIAAGIGIPYELMTGDLSQVNYSSYRAGYNDFKQRSDQLRYQLWAPGFCRKVWNQFYQVADGIGKIKDRPYELEWTPSRYLSVDPVKDFMATMLEVRLGLTSLQESIASNGNDPDKIINEIDAMNKLLDEKKIILDSDPRKVTNSGVLQRTVQETANNATN
jgi:lambda family phage portal protein